MDKFGVPGVSMAIIHDGQLVWSGAYGYADLEQKRKMTVDAICRVESISKPATAWGVMKLVEKGRVGLDDPLQQRLISWELPQSEYADQKVTIRSLLSNSAGMPLGPIGVKSEYDPQGETPPLRDYLNQEAQLICEPGAGFMYSNVGFNLLELLIEDVTGRDFADYMANEVLIPLGMKNSGFEWTAEIARSMPTGYELDGTPVPPYVYSGKASGGLFATAEDIARFVIAGMTGNYHADHAVLNEKSVQLLHTPEVEISGLFGAVAEAYGLGHFIETLPDGRKAVWHGGQGHGWMTHFHAVPESGLGIVVLTNSQRSWPFMARVLSAWAKWSGIKSVKMGRITRARYALQIVIVIVVLISLLQVYRLITGIKHRKRTFEPFSAQHRTVRVVQALLGFIIAGGLAWSVAQPYLFVSSIFPNLVGWAGGSFLLLAIVFIVSAIFPRTDG